MEQTLRHRLVFGALMIIGLLSLLLADDLAQRHTLDLWPRWLEGHGIAGVGLFVLVIAMVVPASRELVTLFSHVNAPPYPWLVVLGAGSLALHAFLTQFAPFRPIAASTLAFTIVAVMILAALLQAIQARTHETIARMSGTVLASLYLGGLAWFLMALRVKRSPHFTGSTAVLLLILLVVKSTDIGAYFGGKAIGRRKLIPWLSPGKTWEGLACGLALASCVSAAMAPLVAGLTWGKALAFGLVIGAVGQAGDLLESLMKRDAQAKDSGRLIPGFGGVLDVIDSPLLAAPAAYLLFSLL